MATIVDDTSFPAAGDAPTGGDAPAGVPAPAGAPANRDRLFLASCVALIVTAMTFAIRAAIIPDLGAEFGLTNVQLGWVSSMAFLGFPIAMMVGGLAYNAVGPRRLMWAAFGCHVLGLVLTITAGGYVGLLVSTFFVGFANGCVEAACNPMIVDMYPGRTTAMLNRFHVWFPGGIVVGSLVGQAMGGMGLGWEAQIGVMLLPTAVYGLLIFGQRFPDSANIESDTGANVIGLIDPLFFFIVVCMTLTAVTEFATTQWVEVILGGSGAQPLLVLALVTGIMALGRFFGGYAIHKVNPALVLLVSAVLASLGVYFLTVASGAGVYGAAVVFALGICFFWPTMIGLVGEYTPRTGALGMSLVGGAGMFAMTIWNPIIGGWLDEASAAGVAAGLEGVAAEVYAGREVLSTMTLFPVALVALFTLLYLWVRNRKTSSELVTEQQAAAHLSGLDVATPASAR